MIVKICGITRQEDAAAAAEAGADALGFNFYSGSPRFLRPDQAARILTEPNVLRVGVFVDASPAEVAAAVETARLDVVQLHGAERAGDYPGLRAWKAIRVREDRAIAEDPDAEMMLLDGPAPGTGTAFRWSAVKHISKRFLVAGGLHADNVAAAIRELRPAGVDTCSGVENEPGIKDHSRMAQFIRTARMASSSSSL